MLELAPWLQEAALVDVALAEVDAAAAQAGGAGEVAPRAMARSREICDGTRG